MNSQAVNYNNTIGAFNFAPMVFIPFFLEAIQTNSTLKVASSPDNNNCQSINWDATFFGCGVVIDGKVCSGQDQKWSVDVSVSAVLASIELFKESVHLDENKSKFCHSTSVGVASIELCLEVVDSSLVLSGEVCGFGGCDHFSQVIISWLTGNNRLLLVSHKAPVGKKGKRYNSLSECLAHCKTDCGMQSWHCASEEKPYFRCVCN